MKQAGRVIALLFAIFIFGGCSSLKENLHLEPGAAVYYSDEFVRRNPPEVHVYPVSETGGVPPSAVFVPFRVTQQMSQPDMVGYSVARTVWQTWAGLRVFDSMEFSGDSGPYRRDLALQLARQRGADLVIGGFVTHYNAGGTAGDTIVSIQVEAHDANTGLLVWSMAQAARMPGPRTTDYMLFANKNRLPSDPALACVQAMAYDTGMLVLAWTRPDDAPPEYRRALPKPRDRSAF